MKTTRSYRFKEYREGRKDVSYLFEDGRIHAKRELKNQHSYDTVKIAGTTMDDGMIFNPRIHRYNIALQYLKLLKGTAPIERWIKSEFLIDELEYLTRADVEVLSVLQDKYSTHWFKFCYQHLLHETYLYYKKVDATKTYSSYEDEIRNYYNSISAKLEHAETYSGIYEIVKNLVVPIGVKPQDETDDLFKTYYRAGRYFTLKYLVQFMKNTPDHAILVETLEKFDTLEKAYVNTVLSNVLYSSGNSHRKIYSELM